MSVNPYVPQSVSGYSNSPPPDDGSAVAANLISYSGIKTRLGDPVLTLSQNIDLAIQGAFSAMVVTTDIAEELLIVFARNVRN